MWSVLMCGLDRFFVSFGDADIERPDDFVVLEAVKKLTFEEKTDFDE